MLNCDTNVRYTRAEKEVDCVCVCVWTKKWVSEWGREEPWTFKKRCILFKAYLNMALSSYHLSLSPSLSLLLSFSFNTFLSFEHFLSSTSTFLRVNDSYSFFFILQKKSKISMFWRTFIYTWWCAWVTHSQVSSVYTALQCCLSNKSQRKKADNFYLL